MQFTPPAQPTRRTLSFALLLLVLWVQHASAYVRGDPVSLVVRTSSRGVTSGWADMRRRSLPRFALNSATDIVPEFQKKTLTTDAAFKLKFALSEHRFLLPWTEIASGAGTFAKEIVFEIQFMGNDVRNVHVHVESYSTPSPTPPSRIQLRYIWKEIPSTDEEMGLHVIMATSLALALGGVVATIFA